MSTEYAAFDTDDTDTRQQQAWQAADETARQAQLESILLRLETLAISALQHFSIPSGTDLYISLQDRNLLRAALNIPESRIAT